MCAVITWSLILAPPLPTPAAATASAAGSPATLVAVLERTPPSSQVQVDEGARMLFARGEALYRSGRSEDALPFLDRLVERLEPRLDRLGEEERLMLRRAARYRATIHWSQGDRSAADESLDLLIRMDPGYRLRDPAPPALQERFEARRERLVGFLRVGMFPSDLRVEIDGEELDPVPDLIPLLAGEHVVRAFRVGYAPQQEEVVIRPNRTENVGFELVRSSATLRLATRPPGATVVVDGDVMGRTRPPPGAATGEEVTSRPLVVEGLLPGWHELEVTLADHRTFRQRVEVRDLTDYDLGVLDLELSVGTLVLRDLPRDARVRVDGGSVEPEWASGAGNLARVALSVGEHRVMAFETGRGMYEEVVSISDGGTVTLTVDLQPGIGLVGVLGGDPLDREAVEENLRRRLRDLGEWVVIDRSRDGVAALEQAAVRPEDLATPDAPAWAEVRPTVEDLAPASLFLVALVPESGDAEAWLWAPAPGPTAPVRFSLAQGGVGRDDELMEALRSPLPDPEPWFGAVVVDSHLADAPVVAGVSPGSPAAMAGLQAGDRIVGLDGEEVTDATGLSARLGALEPFSGVTLQRLRSGAPDVVSLTLGRSPRVTGPSSERDAPIVWAAATARIGRPDDALARWALELQRAQALMGAGAWDRAAELLGRIRAPADEPLGDAAVSYWRGVALLQSEVPDRDGARAALERAAAAATARLGWNDGPLVAPRARARLDRLGGTSDGG